MFKYYFITVKVICLGIEVYSNIYENNIIEQNPVYLCIYRCKKMAPIIVFYD